MKLVLFILACAGIVNSVINNGFFNFLRETKYKLINKLFNCSLCFGFWVGMFVFYLMDITKIITYDECYIYKLTNLWYIDMVLYGFIASYASYLLCNVAGNLEKKR